MPTVTPTVAPTAAQEAGASDCGGGIREAIEGAAEAQAAYMEGTLGADGLAEWWGRAAADAQAQADRLVRYRDAEISAVDIAEAAWEVKSCRAERYGDWARATVNEAWTYEAQVTCVSGATGRSLWVESLPREVYALVRQDGRWVVDSWLTGPVTVERKWGCP